ncbi:MAG: hypothetical protein HOG55_01560, partial [Anaerolineae bacterium]|nr:hypothetical protein [Anaerolineae bacterium]
MSYQRRVLYFSVFVALFLSSCIPTVSASSSLSSGNLNSDEHKDLLVPGRCIEDGYQIYISRKGNYCFAYPFEFYMTWDEENDSIILHTASTVVDQNPETMFIAKLLTVFYEEHKDYELDEFIERQLSDEEIYRIHFHLEGEKAFLISTGSEDDSVSFLHVFTSHNDIYYHASFEPSFRGTNRTSEKYLV